MTIILSISSLQNNTFSGLFVGQNLIRVKELASTNSFLKDAVSKSTPLLEGTVIMADKQFAGRGQSENSWLSEPFKNLTFSILFTPGFLAVQSQFYLNIAISLGILDSLEKLAVPQVTIKWPNDIYVGSRKICGTLIENVLAGPTIKHAIVGIGLNVNQTEFPDSLINVTSLKQILQKDYDLVILLADLCQSIEARYLQLKAGKYALLSNDYAKNLYLLNTWALFRYDEQVSSGKIVGVSETGLLDLQTSSEVRQFNNKEIEYINT